MEFSSELEAKTLYIVGETKNQNKRIKKQLQVGIIAVKETGKILRDNVEKLACHILLWRMGRASNNAREREREWLGNKNIGSGARLDFVIDWLHELGQAI